MLEELQKPQRAVGAKQVGRALRAGRVTYVFLAEDADPKVTSPIALLCEQQSVPIEQVSSMAVLGQACSIPVGCAVAALTK